jgi:hypothetical protein
MMAVPAHPSRPDVRPNPGTPIVREGAVMVT